MNAGAGGCLFAMALRSVDNVHNELASLDGISPLSLAPTHVTHGFSPIGCEIRSPESCNDSGVLPISILPSEMEFVRFRGRNPRHGLEA